MSHIFFIHLVKMRVFMFLCEASAKMHRTAPQFRRHAAAPLVDLQFRKDSAAATSCVTDFFSRRFCQTENACVALRYDGNHALLTVRLFIRPSV